MQPEQNAQTWSQAGREGPALPGQEQAWPAQGAYAGSAGWVDPPANGAWAGQAAYAGQAGPEGHPGSALASHGQPAYSGPAPTWQPGGLWQEQAGQHVPPADQWAGATTSSPQAATPPPAGASWQAQAASVAPSSGLWQSAAQEASPPSGGHWPRVAATGQEHPVTAPAGGLWQQTQSTGLQPADGQWQHAQQASPGGGQWQQAQSPVPGGESWQQAQTAPHAGGLSQPRAQMTAQEEPAPSGLFPGNGNRTSPAPAQAQPSYPGQQAQPSYPGQQAQPSYPGQQAQPSYPGQQAQPSYPGQQAQPSYPGQEMGGPWGLQPPPGETQPWMVQFNSQPAIAPMRRRGPWKAVVIGIVALAAVVGGGATGVNAYAKHTVCSTLKGESPGAARGGSTEAGDDGAPSAAELAEMRKDADTLRTYGRMLVVSGGLREAVDGLADDEDQMVGLVKSATAAGDIDEATAKKQLAELVTIVGSVNSHAREAQRACGLPVTGIFND
jgi:hypothetical protein